MKKLISIIVTAGALFLGLSSTVFAQQVINGNNIRFIEPLRVGSNTATTTISGSATSTFPGGITTKLLIATTSIMTGLVSCDTIDTDSEGTLLCGTDSTGGAAAVNLQQAYDAGAGMIVGADTKDVIIFLQNTATDPNFAVNIDDAGAGLFLIQTSTAGLSTSTVASIDKAGTGTFIKLITDTMMASTSNGIDFKNSSNGQVMSVGAGPGTDVTINGALNVGTSNFHYVKIQGGSTAMTPITYTAFSSQDNASFNFVPKGNGAFGVGTTTASTTLSVAGGGLFKGILTAEGLMKGDYIIATSSTATSTFGGIDGVGLSKGIVMSSIGDFGFIKATSTVATSTIGISDADGTNDFGLWSILGSFLQLVTDALHITGRIESTGVATNTFAGGISVAAIGGLSSASGLTISAGDLLMTSGKITLAGSATSTFPNLNVSTLFTTPLLDITGKFESTYLATSSWLGALTIAKETTLGRNVSAPCNAIAFAATTTVDVSLGNCFAITDDVTSDFTIVFVKIPASFTNFMLEYYSPSSNFQPKWGSASGTPNIVYNQAKSTSTPAEGLQGINVWSFQATSSASSLKASFGGSFR